MALQIWIQVDTAAPDNIDITLEKSARAALRQQQIVHGELSILLTDDAALKALNRQFRQVDQATDVLSFPGGDSDSSLTGEAPYLGDIAIAVPYAARQAASQGHSLEAELQLLTVHGVLHLLGHDHGDATEKAIMWEAQELIMAEIGQPDVTPSESY